MSQRSIDFREDSIIFAFFSDLRTSLKDFLELFELGYGSFIKSQVYEPKIKKTFVLIFINVKIDF